MRVRATAFAEGAGGWRGSLGLVLLPLTVLAIVVALVVLLAQLRETVLLSSPEVRAAQARASIAEADRRTAELQRDTAAAHAEQATSANWWPRVVGAEQLAMVALMGAVPVALVAALVAGLLLLRRHLSLPTGDGRVPVVGLDRELSREALLRYQALKAPGPIYEALPLDGVKGELEAREADREPGLTQRDGADALRQWGG